jgi:hypothetical protein
MVKSHFVSSKNPLPLQRRCRKGLTEEHLESMLRYAQDTGDMETSGIVDAMTRMLECRGWRMRRSC